MLRDVSALAKKSGEEKYKEFLDDEAIRQFREAYPNEVEGYSFFNRTDYGILTGN